MSEREAIARIIGYEFENGPEQFVCPKAADRIIAEYIEPLRAAFLEAEREIRRVCDLGDKRTRERDQAMTACEDAESRVSELEEELKEFQVELQEQVGKRLEAHKRISALEALLAEAATILDEAQCCIAAEDQVEVFHRITAVLAKLKGRTYG